MVLVYCFSVVINETSLLLSKFITNQKSYSKYFVFIILVKSLITCFHKNFLKMWTSQRFPLRYNYPVFVCVCILCLIDLNFIPHYSRHQLSLSSRSFFILTIWQLGHLPYYKLITSLHWVLLLDLVLLCCTQKPSCILATPTRKQCHHRPMHQIRSLPDARPFFTRAAEEQAVGPHYC